MTLPMHKRISACSRSASTGELDPQLCFNLANGYSATLSGNVHFGEGVLGGSASLNLRQMVVHPV